MFCSAVCWSCAQEAEAESAAADLEITAIRRQLARAQATYAGQQAQPPQQDSAQQATDQAVAQDNAHHSQQNTQHDTQRYSQHGSPQDSQHNAQQNDAAGVSGDGRPAALAHSEPDLQDAALQRQSAQAAAETSARFQVHLPGLFVCSDHLLALFAAICLCASILAQPLPAALAMFTTDQKLRDGGQQGKPACLTGGLLARHLFAHGPPSAMQLPSFVPRIR